MFLLNITFILLLAIISQFGYLFAVPINQDLESAASGDEHGRVQIKVFRGPTEHDGHDHFAPWGYWVKQPADQHH